MPLRDPTSNEQKHAKLTSAVIIGATTAGSSRIWVRLYREGRWTLVLSTTPLVGDLVRLEEKPLADFLAQRNTSARIVGSHDFSRDSNLTHVFDVDGLQADTSYFYAVIAEERDAAVVSRRTEIGGDAPRWFRTLPQAPAEITFGFYSCHDHISANGDAGAWPHFLEKLTDARAQFVIGGGDQAYVDTNSQHDFPDIWRWLKDNKQDLLQKFSTGGGNYDQAGIRAYLLDLYRWYYRVYWSVPALREVYERFPQYMMWDDHEIMDGWGSLTWAERREKICGLFEQHDAPENQMLLDLMWQAACQSYYEYEHSHNPPTQATPQQPDDCQWDYAFRHGDAAFYVLDMRGHHDVEKALVDPYIILGRPQFDRFTQWLDQALASQAKSLFIVSPVPVVHWVDRLVNYADLGEAKDDFMDEWGHESNRWERNQLLDALFARIANKNLPVVFLSGDVHCASAFRLRHRRYPSAKVYQVTSSAISRKPAPRISQLGIWSGGDMDGHAEIFCEQLFALAGNKNFALVRQRPDELGVLNQITVDLCWPGGEEGELAKKRLALG